MWYLQAGECQAEPRRAAALGLDDRGQLLHGLLDVTVHQQVVAAPPERDLLARARQAPRALLLVVGAPLPQPLLQLLHRRREDEAEARLGIAGADLRGALRVDVEQNVVAPA